VEQAPYDAMKVFKLAALLSSVRLAPGAAS
jgi:hypothetical protein